MSQNKNTVFISGITSGLVYRLWGLDYVFPELNNAETRDSEIVGQVGKYLEGEFYLSNWPGATYADGSAGFQEIRYYDGVNPLKMTETKFLIISEDDFENSEWWPWCKFFETARVLDSDNINNTVKHDVKFISQSQANYDNPDFSTSRVVKQIILVDKPVYESFDTYENCVSSFTDIMEITKDKFNNSFSGHSYEYEIEIISGETIFNLVSGYGLTESGLACLKEYYEPEGLFYHTANHFACLVTSGFGFYTGYANEYAPWSTLDVSTYLSRDPELSLDEFYGTVILHELGHNLGLDHTFTNIQRGWNKLFPSLTLDGIDNLTRYGNGRLEPTFNDGNLFISYSGESPAKAAIMSYQLDPSWSYNCPINVNKLIDSGYDFYSGATLYQDYPFDTISLGCLFINKTGGDIKNYSGGPSGSNTLTGLNLNLIGYMTGDTEFVSGEITGFTVNYTANTSVEKYKQPELLWDTRITDQDIWNDTSEYYIKFFNNITNDEVTILSKTSILPYPDNIQSGTTTENNIVLTGSSFTNIESSVLDYLNLTEIGLRIEYNGNVDSNDPSNTILEFLDLNIDIMTTGGTITRKATNYNNFYTGTTKVNHVGVPLPYNTGFTSYEVKGCEYALKVMDYLFSLSPDITNEASNYLLIIDEDNRNFIVTDLRDFSQETYNIDYNQGQFYSFALFKKVLIKDDYFYLLSKYRDNSINTYIDGIVFGKYKIISYKPFILDYDPEYIFRLNLDGVYDESIQGVESVDGSIYTFYKPQSGNWYSASTVGGESILTDLTLTSDNRYPIFYQIQTFDEVNIDGLTKRYVLVKGNYISGYSIQQYRSTIFGENIESTYVLDNTDPNLQSLFVSGTSIKEVFYRDWLDGEGTRLNLLTNKGLVIRLDGFDKSQNTYEITGSTIMYDFQLDSNTNTTSKIKFGTTTKKLFFEYYYILSGVNSNYIYNLPFNEYTGNTISSGDYVTGYTYTKGYYMPDLLYVNNNPVPNSEIFYYVVGLEEYTPNGYAVYHAENVDLPIYSGDNANVNIPYGKIDYNFNVVDSTFDQQLTPYNGEIKIMIHFYHDNNISQTEIDNIQLIASLIEDLPNLDTNMDFTIICDVELVSPGHVLFDGWNSSWTIDNYGMNFINKYGSIYDYNGYHYGIMVDYFSGYNGVADILGQYCAVSRPNVGNAPYYIYTTFIHELGHCFGLYHSFVDRWKSIFNELTYKCLDPTYDLPPSYWGATEQIGDQSRVNLPYNSEFVDTPSSGSTSIMGYRKYEYEYYSAPKDAQWQLEQKVYDKLEAYPDSSLYTVFYSSYTSNVVYYNFLENGELTLSQIDNITIGYVQPYYTTANTDNMKIVNTGSSQTYTFMISQVDDIVDLNKTVTIDKTNFQDIFDDSNQISFGIEINRSFVTSGGTDWLFPLNSLYIEFNTTDGQTIKKYPKDCFTLTSEGNRLHIYIHYHGRATQYSSYEKEVINNTFQYKWKNYLNNFM
jgi:hypothetical protein